MILKGPKGWDGKGCSCISYSRKVSTKMVFYLHIAYTHCCTCTIFFFHFYLRHDIEMELVKQCWAVRQNEHFQVHFKLLNCVSAG